MDAEQRYAALVEELAGEPGVSPPGTGRSFGAAALKVDGRIFAMLMDGALVVKLPTDRVRGLLAEGTGGPFDSSKGTPMREWVSLAPAADWSALAREALAFVARR